MLLGIAKKGGRDPVKKHDAQMHWTLRFILNCFGVIDVSWSMYEAARGWTGKQTVLGDAIGFFQDHPEHVTGMYIALAAGGITLLLQLNWHYLQSVSAWRAGHKRRRQARWPENRLRALWKQLNEEYSRLRFDLHEQSVRSKRLQSDQFIAWSILQRQLSELGIPAPDPSSDPDVWFEFLVNLLPLAKDGRLLEAQSLHSLLSRGREKERD